MGTSDAVWKIEAVSKAFLEGVRSSLPLAREQIEIMLRITKKALPNIDCFLDLGCGDEDWVDTVENKAPFDVIVSGLAIHHQPDQRKKALYQELFNLLKPGGLFLNLEHVASGSKWVESVNDDLLIDALYEFHKEGGSNKTRSEIADEFYYRPDKEANILALVEDQCEWLKELGYVNVDCFFKVFEVALFGGMRPNGRRDIS